MSLRDSIKAISSIRSASFDFFGLFRYCLACLLRFWHMLSARWYSSIHFSISNVVPYVERNIIRDTRNSSSRLSFFNFAQAFASYPRSRNICLVFSFKSIAFARHLRAFREVVNEGLLKACRVNVSIPYNDDISWKPGNETGSSASLLREYWIRICRIATIYFYLFEVGIPFYKY